MAISLAIVQVGLWLIIVGQMSFPRVLMYLAGLPTEIDVSSGDIMGA